VNPASPVFVVGVGRSGTSLVQSMLAAHPAFGFPPETGFFRRYVARGVLRRLARQGGTMAVAERLASDERLRRLRVPARELVARAERPGSLSDASIYRELLMAYAPAGSGVRAGDKDPRTVEHLGLLHRVYPEGYVVHVIRDPRDVLASKKAADWSRGRPVLRHVLAGRAQLRLGRRDGRRHFVDRYVEVFYEDLLRAPEVTLRRLCAGVSVRYDPAMLEYRDAAAELVARDEMQWKAETLGPLLTGNVDKWRGVLTAREAHLTEKACVEAMRAGGYTPGRGNAVGPLDRVAIGLTAGALAVAGCFYRLSRRLRDAVQRV